jgi:hypothetical protein
LNVALLLPDLSHMKPLQSNDTANTLHIWSVHEHKTYRESCAVWAAHDHQQQSLITANHYWYNGVDDKHESTHSRRVSCHISANPGFRSNATMTQISSRPNATHEFQRSRIASRFKMYDLLAVMISC